MDCVVPDRVRVGDSNIAEVECGVLEWELGDWLSGEIKDTSIGN